MKPGPYTPPKKSRAGVEAEKYTRWNIASALHFEANRYRQLAEVEALKVVLNPVPQGDLLVRQHLLRAETFKAAAAIAGGAL